MHHVIYTSRSTRPFSGPALAALLQQAQATNARQGITGVLLYGSNLFVQVLEGEQAAVEALCTRLVRDPRHTGLVRLADKPIAHRSFAGWAMGFQHLPPVEVAGLPGVLTDAQLTAQLAGMAAADALLLHTMRRLLLPPAAN